MASILEGLALFNTAAEAGKNVTSSIKRLVGIAEPAVVADLQVRIAEMFAAVTAAQSEYLSLQSRYATALERIGQLERAEAERGQFEAEAQNYELKSIGPDTLVYVQKATSGGGDQHGGPAEYLCAHCFGQKKKSILQYEARKQRTLLLRCPACGNAVHKTREEPTSAGVTVAPVRRRSWLDDY